MFVGFLGQFRPAAQKPEDEIEKTTKGPESQKSNSAEEFLATPAAKSFVSKWAKKERDGKPLYKKRGITRLLSTIFPRFSSDKETLLEAEELLGMLGGMDKLEGFLSSMKAAPHGIIKSLKSVLGGGK